MAILQSKGSLGELEKKLGYGSMAFDQLYELIKSAIEVISKVGNGDNPLLQQLETVGLIFNKAKENTPGNFTLLSHIYSSENDGTDWSR